MRQKLSKTFGKSVSIRWLKPRHANTEPPRQVSLLRLLHYLSGDTRVLARVQLERMGTVCMWEVIVGLHPRSPQSFCMTTCSENLTNLTPLLFQSRDNSCYVSRPILAPPPPCLHKQTDLRADDFARCPDLWHEPRLANVTCSWSWRLRGITPAIYAGNNIKRRRYMLHDTFQHVGAGK